MGGGDDIICPGWNQNAFTLEDFSFIFFLNGSLSLLFPCMRYGSWEENLFEVEMHSVSHMHFSFSHLCH